MTPIARLFVAATVAAAVSPTPVMAAFSGYYRITARHSGKAVVVQSASTANAADVIQWSYTADASGNDEWELVDLGTGYHRVVNRNSGKVLNVAGASTANGGNVDQWAWANVNQQQWQIVDLGNGYHRLTARHSGKVLNVAGVSTADGANVDQWSWSNVDQQMFEIAAVGAPPIPTPTPTATPMTPTPTATPTSTPTPTPTPVSGHVDITPGGSGVTASTNDGNLPANTVDKSLATRWSGNGDGAWIQYDLGATFTVGHVRIAVYNGDGRQNRFDLQVSNGGGTWVDVLPNALTSGTTTQLETHDFGDVNARFVRYLGHMSTVGTFNSVTEVEIWGSPCASCPTPVTPTATPTPTRTPTPTPTPTPDGSGNTYRVTSLSELQSRMNAAVAGDTILLANGTYTVSTALTISRSGTGSQPIVVSAETIGGVTLNGSAAFNVNSPAQHVHVRGFRFFMSTSVRSFVGTRFIRFTRNHFENRPGSYLVVDGDDSQVDHNEFSTKSTVGQMLKIGGATTRPAERTWAHHNYFHDFSNVGSNGGETIQVAVGENSMRPAFSVIEYNLFVRCNGENEMISNKSGSNTYRGNTFRDSTAGELTLRDGDDVTIEGNFFFNTKGMRLFGDNHKVFNNYLERCGLAILVGSGTNEDHFIGQTGFGGYDRVGNLRLSHNTLVNNVQHLVFQTRTLGANSPRIANNIIQGDTGTLVQPGDPLTSPTWEGNILWGAAANGSMPASGFRRVNPMLVMSGGLFRLSAGSPAVDTGVGSYAEVVLDMDGQSRSGVKDVGADELLSTSIVRRPLTTADVGPNAP